MIGYKSTASVTDTTALRRPGLRTRWRTGRKPYLISVVFLAVLLVGGLWVLVVPPGSPQATTPVVAPTVVPTLASDAMPSPAVICSAQPPVELDPEQLVTATYITTWYPVGTMSAPSSTAAGPGQARRCFARTPEGALYAAVTRMVEEAIATGVTQEAASKGVTGIHFDGYQWLTYTPDRAVLMVRVAASNSVETRHVARVLDVTWTADSDWAVVPDDTTAAASAAADPKRVFTPWGDG